MSHCKFHNAHIFQSIITPKGLYSEKEFIFYLNMFNEFELKC